MTIRKRPSLNAAKKSGAIKTSGSVKKPLRTKKKLTASSATAKPKKVASSTPREVGDHGFVVGTDTAIIADALLTGGADRDDVNDLAEKAIAETNGIQNRNGNDKYVPSLVSQVLNKMLRTNNYEIEATWKLVKIDRPVTRKKLSSVKPTEKTVKKPIKKRIPRK